MKKQEGITLVALVVTIIIIILSTVTISAIFGENGIIKKAELARDLASNSIAKENEDMNSLMDKYSNVMNGDGEIPEPPDPIEPTDPTEQEATPIAEVTRDKVFDEITGSVESPTEKKSGKVITDQNWYNLKKACSNVVSSKYAQSTMIYGNQWDEVMSWLIATGGKKDSEVNSNSSSWGNYNSGSSPKTAGYSETWKANNIYDLAGNCYEWTQEADSTNGRVFRGGSCNYSGSDNPASDRYSDYPRNSRSNGSSRPALYLILNAE